MSYQDDLLNFFGYRNMIEQLKKNEKSSSSNDKYFEFIVPSRENEDYDFILSLDEIFSPTFISSNSEFNSLDDMFKTLNIPLDNLDFLRFPEAQLDNLIRNNSIFQTFEEMFQVALTEYLNDFLRDSL